MPAEISPSLALELIFGPTLPSIAGPLARPSAPASTDSAALALQGINIFAQTLFGRRVTSYNRALAALDVAARFTGANPNDSNDGNDDGNDDGNYQEIGQNDGNDSNDSRIDLVDMDELGIPPPTASNAHASTVVAIGAASASRASADMPPVH